MAANRLAMNPAKTDVLWCPTSDQPSDSPLTLVGVTVLPSSYMRNLSMVFDSDSSLKAHVSQLRASCYSCLRRIKSCQRAFTRIQWQRLHRARGTRAPTFTNGWARGHCETE